MDTSHVFPQGLLAALTSGGVRLEMERLELDLGMRPGFPSVQWLSAPYWCGLSQVAGAQDLRVGPKVTWSWGRAWAGHGLTHTEHQKQPSSLLAAALP